jgi:hypothetical protein
MPQSAPQQSPQPQQWACHLCGQLIQPPGNEGKLDIEGNHFCSACEQLAVLLPSDSPGAGTTVAPIRRSSRNLPAQRGSGITPVRGSSTGVHPARRSATAMATPHAMPGHKGLAIPAWMNLIKPLVILALLGGLGYWVVTRKMKSDAEESRKVAEESAAPAQTQIHRRGTVKPADPSPAKTAARPVPSAGTGPALKPAAVPVASTTSAPETTPATPVAPAVSENDLKAGLEQVVQLVKDSRYGAAKSLLRELEGAHTGKEWWAAHEQNWTTVGKEVKQQWKEMEEEAKDAREMLAKPTREGVERIVEGWRKYAVLDDELSGELGKQIVHEAARARIKVIEEARSARVVQIEQQLTDFEKAMKASTGSRKQEEMLKFLTALDDEILQNPTWEERLAPRVIGLRFDVKRARDGDLLVYRAVTRVQGGIAELLYDFAAPEQFSAWNYNTPDRNETSSRATWDPAEKNVLLHASGGHDWKGKDRNGMPFLSFPLDFPAGCVVEADVTASALNGADTGLLIWEGGANVLFFSLRDATDKKGAAEWLFKVDGHMEKTPDVDQELGRCAAPEKKTVRLFVRLASGNAYLAAALGNRPLALKQQPVRLNFKPNFLGLYVRTRGGDASAAFDNVKITGQPDPQALRNKAELARQVEVNTAKDEWRKQAQSARVARDQAAGAIPKEWFADWMCATAEACTTFPDHPNARTTRPTNPAALPCWSRRVKLEAYKTHYIHADVNAPQGVDWTVGVRVNNREIFSQVVTGPEWRMVDVDLTPYGGEDVLLEIVNRPAGNQDGETAYWDRVYVGSR